MSLCIVHGHVHPEHDRYRLEFFYQSRIPCVWSRTGLFVVFSLFTSFCRDTSCQARPFCRENIVPLYNLGGSNPSRVNLRGDLASYFKMKEFRFGVEDVVGVSDFHCSITVDVIAWRCINVVMWCNVLEVPVGVGLAKMQWSSHWQSWGCQTLLRSGSYVHWKRASLRGQHAPTHTSHPDTHWITT